MVSLALGVLIRFRKSATFLHREIIFQCLVSLLANILC
jgi:hypothetical protein